MFHKTYTLCYVWNKGLVYITVSNTLQLNKLLSIQETHKGWDYRTIVQISCTADQFNKYLVKFMSSLNSFVGNPVLLKPHQAERMVRLWDLVTSLVFKLLHPKLWSTHGIPKNIIKKSSEKFCLSRNKQNFGLKQTSVIYYMSVNPTYKIVFKSKKNRPLQTLTQRFIISVLDSVNFNCKVWFII